MIDRAVMLDDLIAQARALTVRVDASHRPEWDAGFKARRDGKPNKANPYDRDTEEYDEWKKGWQDGA